MQTSSLLLFLVALYPCAALASLAVPVVLGPLNRWMKENEDPRVAKSWIAMGVCALGAGLGVWIALRAPASEVVFLRLGRYGFAVDQSGPLGVSLVSLLGLIAAIALRPQTPGLRLPHGWLLLACGGGAVALLAEDVRLALLGLESALVFLGLCLLAETDRRESRAAALRWFLAAQPGFVILAVSALGLAGRASTYALGDIRNAVAADVPANVTSLHWMLLGFTWLLTVPALPWALRDVLSRRTLPAAIATLSVSAGLIGWLMLRLIFRVCPYAEGWDLARRGWLVIPGLSLCTAALLVGAAFWRSPSPRLSLVLASVGPLVPLAFSLGRPAFTVGIVLLVVGPLLRAALLASQAADPAVGSKPPAPGTTRAHRLGVVLSALLLVAAPCLLLPRFVQGWYRLAFGVVLVAPACLAALRVARFGWGERQRRLPLPAWLSATCGVAGLAALVLWGPMHRLSTGIEKELGLDLTFAVRHRAPGGAPPAGGQPPADRIPLPGGVQGPAWPTPPAPGTPPPRTPAGTPSGR